MTEFEDNLLNLCRIVMKLGQVQRITKDEHGNYESDTTHSIMLSIIACYISENQLLGLDRGLLAQFATIHDLQEYRCGDTPTLRIDEEGKRNKSRIENQSLELLREQFPSSWLETMLFRYHCQEEREARFIRALDKLLPKLTHINNNCQTLKQIGMSKSEFHDRITTKQHEDIKSYASDFPFLLELHHSLALEIEQLLEN